MARALRESIFTEAADLASLHEQECDTVRHCEEGRQPKEVRLHFVREEVKFREKVSDDETR